MNSLKLGLVAALLVVATAMVAQGLISTSHRLASAGRLKAMGVGVYWDAPCTNPVSSINWGLVEPGETKNVTVFIRNEGNALARLSIATENWKPAEACSYISLTWNYAGQWLAPMAVIPVTLSLRVAGDVQNVDTFSFDIIITTVG